MSKSLSESLDKKDTKVKNNNNNIINHQQKEEEEEETNQTKKLPKVYNHSYSRSFKSRQNLINYIKKFQRRNQEIV